VAAKKKATSKKKRVDSGTKTSPRTVVAKKAAKKSAKKVTAKRSAKKTTPKKPAKKDTSKKNKSTTTTRSKVKSRTAAEPSAQTAQHSDSAASFPKTALNSTDPAADTKTRQTKLPFPIVGIGASAGGLQAFEEFFQALPADPGMSFVLVSHLDPHHASILHELLGKSALLPVIQAINGVRIEVNTAYVAPPGKELAIRNGRLQLLEPVASHLLRHPIDTWFRSLAQDQKQNGTAIILSGNGTDGTLGAKEINAQSGMVIVQDPLSAKFPGMPESVISMGLADYVMRPREMPQHLIRYTDELSDGDLSPELRKGPLKSAPVALQRIFALLRARTGNDFSYYKTSTLRRRIERRMVIHQIQKNSHYVQYLEENPQEVDLLFKELLIGVTKFFRDSQAFIALADDVLPPLIKSKPEDATLRVWVPGCSTGEEAYSLAILLRETITRLKKRIQVQIFATDLDSQAIEHARVGVYAESITVDVSPRRLTQFFSHERDGRYRISKAIRETVIFAEQNVISDPSFTKLDILSCRNLLIYLQAGLQRQLLPLFHHSLRPGGILFLGSSETIGGFGALFEAASKEHKLFRRKEGSTPLHLAAKFPVTVERPVTEFTDDFVSESRTREPTTTNVAQLSSKLLSDRYAPPSVVVNERGDLVYVHGNTGLYLQPAPGQPTHNVLAMARDDLRLELSTALRQASRGDKEVSHKGIQIKSNGGFVRLDLTATKIESPGPMRGLVILTFAAEANVEHAASGAESSNKKGHGKKTAKERVLERELKHAKESLRTTIEDLETSNEELTSANEELQSTNEEMQSTNEELETSKEEMQSLNEELQTVNSELEGKIGEVSQASDDMINLLSATDIATIFLDNQLCVKRFNEQATDVVRLIQADVGRPLADIVSKLDYADLGSDAQEVLRTLTYKQAVVRSEDNNWYLMKILPYRTAENMIDGLVITFVNIDVLKDAERILMGPNVDGGDAHTRDRVRSMIELGDVDGYRSWLGQLIPNMMIDVESLQITYANASAAQVLGATDAIQVVGKSVLDFVAPDAVDYVQRHLQTSSNRMGVESELTRIRLKKLDGSIVEVKGIALSMAGGNGPAVLAVALQLGPVISSTNEETRR
jgi:two-component system CheB/CheR fusion protein